MSAGAGDRAARAPRPWLSACAALLAFAAVAAGAFAAHALRAVLAPQALALVETAARYQMVHALGALAIGLAGWPRGRLAAAAGWSMIAGTVLFSGSLYLLAWGGARWFGAVTPFGGVGFLIGWLLLAAAALRERGR